MDPLAILLLIVGSTVVTFALLGSAVGKAKGSSGKGAILGAALGPIGIVATMALDGRHQCPKCNTKLNGKPKVCPGCRAEFEWPQPIAKQRVLRDPMIEIRFNCTHCNAALRRKSRDAGYLTRCAACKQSCLVPVPEGWSNDEPPPLAPVTIKASNTTDCPDCGGTVSKRATACPHCGAPV